MEPWSWEDDFEFQKHGQRERAFSALWKSHISLSLVCKIDSKALHPRPSLSSLSMPTTTAESLTLSASSLALSRWNVQFQTRHLTLQEHERGPFYQGLLLGCCGGGAFFETQLNGNALAWKKTCTRRLNKLQLSYHHQHVRGLIRSSDHCQDGHTMELGLLLWPVAQLNLSSFLYAIDILNLLLR